MIAGFSPPTTPSACVQLTEHKSGSHVLRRIGDNLHTRRVLFLGMSDDANHLRKWAAHLLALSMSTDDKEWAAHIALRAADYLAAAEEINKKAAEAQKAQKSHKDIERASSRVSECELDRRLTPVADN